MNPRILASARTFALAAAAATAMVLSGCNATMTDVWQDGDYDGPGLHKVLVVADWKDEGARRLWEDQLRASFAKQHVEAVPSYRVSSAALDDSVAVRQAVLDNGLDGAVILQPLATQTSSHWEPGFNTSVAHTWYDPRSRSYRTVLREVHHPGYPVRDHIVRQRVIVWTSNDGGRLLWTATAELVDPSSHAADRESVANGLVSQLNRAKLF